MLLFLILLFIPCNTIIIQMRPKKLKFTVFGHSIFWILSVDMIISCFSVNNISSEKTRIVMTHMIVMKINCFFLEHYDSHMYMLVSTYIVAADFSRIPMAFPVRLSHIHMGLSSVEGGKLVLSGKKDTTGTKNIKDILLFFALIDLDIFYLVIFMWSVSFLDFFEVFLTLLEDNHTFFIFYHIHVHTQRVSLHRCNNVILRPVLNHLSLAVYLKLEISLRVDECVDCTGDLETSLLMFGVHPDGCQIAELGNRFTVYVHVSLIINLKGMLLNGERNIICVSNHTL
jgi:hypothetical protein